MSYKIEDKEEELQKERKNHREFIIAAIAADGEEAVKFAQLRDQSSAKIQELETELEELQQNFENSQKPSIQTESSSILEGFTYHSNYQAIEKIESLPSRNNAEINDTDLNCKVHDKINGTSDHNGYPDTNGGHGVNERYENYKGKHRSRKRRPKKKGSQKLKRPENLCKYLFTKRGCYSKNCKFNHGKWAGRRKTAGVTITDSQVANVNNTMYDAVKSAIPMSSKMMTTPVPQVSTQVSPHAQMMQNPIPKMASQLNQVNDGHVTGNCYFMESKYKNDYTQPRMTPYGVTSSMMSAAPSHMAPYRNQFSTLNQPSHTQNMKWSSKKKFNLSTVPKVKKRNAFVKLRYQIKKLKAENQLLKTEENRLTQVELAQKSQIISEFRNTNSISKPVVTSQFVSMTSPSHVPKASGPSFGGDGTNAVCRNERPVRQKKPPRVSKAKFAPIVDKLSMSTTPDHNLVDQNYKSDDSGYDNSTESSISDHENENEHTKAQNLGKTDVNVTGDDVVQAYYNGHGNAHPIDNFISEEFIKCVKGLPSTIPTIIYPEDVSIASSIVSPVQIQMRPTAVPQRPKTKNSKKKTKRKKKNSKRKSKR